MHLLRSLFFWLARTQVSLEAVHIPGRKNGPADSLSHNDTALFILTGILYSIDSISSSTSSGGVVDEATPRLDITDLDSLVGRYFMKGLAESTLKSYSSSQNATYMYSSVRMLSFKHHQHRKQYCVILLHAYSKRKIKASYNQSISIRSAFPPYFQVTVIHSSRR